MWDALLQTLKPISEEEAKYAKAPVFHVGEEIELKGITFVIVDIAPAQMKLKPKRH